MWSMQNVLNQFLEVIKDPRCHFFGNVTVGQDVGLPLLHSLYHAVRAVHLASNLALHVTQKMPVVKQSTRVS